MPCGRRGLDHAWKVGCLRPVRLTGVKGMSAVFLIFLGRATRPCAAKGRVSTVFRPE